MMATNTENPLICSLPQHPLFPAETPSASGGAQPVETQSHPRRDWIFGFCKTPGHQSTNSGGKNVLDVLKISNVNLTVKYSQLHSIFSQYGYVTRMSTIKERDTVCVYIWFYNPDAAFDAFADLKKQYPVASPKLCLSKNLQEQVSDWVPPVDPFPRRRIPETNRWHVATLDH